MYIHVHGIWTWIKGRIYIYPWSLNYIFLMYIYVHGRWIMFFGCIYTSVAFKGLIFLIFPYIFIDKVTFFISCWTCLITNTLKIHLLSYWTLLFLFTFKKGGNYHSTLQSCWPTCWQAYCREDQCFVFSLYFSHRVKMKVVWRVPEGVACLLWYYPV